MDDYRKVSKVKMDNSVSPKFRKITKSAESLFIKFGLKKVTVEEICHEAGVSKMTFYKYFKNKIELAKYLWKTGIDDAMNQLDELDRMDASFPEKVNLILKLKEESVSQWGNQYIRDYLEMMPELLDFYNEIFNRVITRFMDMIHKAQDKGEVRKSMKPEFFLLIAQKMIELFKDEQLSSLYPDYTELALEINNFLYYGIMPIPGKENR